MAIISFYSLKIIFGHFTRCNWTCLLSMVFVGFFGGKWYKNGLFEATTHKNTDFTALNAGIRWEKNIYFCTHLYHRDHADRLFPAIYVGAKINQYLILRLWHFFCPKSLLVCIPSTGRGHSSKLREISFTRLTIEKKYFFNKINLYVLE